MASPSFGTRFVTALPGDPSAENVPRQVTGALWSRVLPTPVPAPRLLAASPEVQALLGLDDAALQALLPVLAGNAPPPGGTPFAANYGGHQFGHWAGQLGDGRAIGLGELAGYELQLKGAGPTPYSRRGDGRAVLRSSIREFLCSEAMHHLGVPTTRALALVATGEQVLRDMFYDGHAALEPGAIVTRVAPTFIRFGTFELCTARDDLALLRRLVDFTCAHYFPGVEGAEALFLEVARRTARLVAHWQAVGFVHGVMNTDNMSVLGLTIDYGPYGWVDDFDPAWTPNTTDAGQRRYAFGNQPAVGLWNVHRLGLALLPLLGDDEARLEAGLRAYQQAFAEASSAHFAAKLGLAGLTRDGDEALVQDCFAWLAAEETDLTRFFRGLSRGVLAAELPTALPEWMREAAYREPSPGQAERGVAWLQRWWRRTRLEAAPPEALARRLDAVNPRYVLRNWLAQEAIDAAHAGDDSKVHALLEVLRRPFTEQPGREHYAQKRPEWARAKPGCSALSCSS